MVEEVGEDNNCVRHAHTHTHTWVTCKAEAVAPKYTFYDTDECNSVGGGIIPLLYADECAL